MKMRPVAGGLEIKPGQTVTLDPNGYHVMFVGLKKQLMQGDQFKATLEFAKGGKINVDFSVVGVGAQTGGGADAIPGMQIQDGGMKMK
jgi:copper(I)-binding protein